MFCLNEARANPAKKTKAASFKDQQNIITRLAAAGVEELVISGGEPLIHPHCTSLIAHAANLGMKVSIQTNGYFINEKFLQKVKGKLSFIQVSLEGTIKEHELVTWTHDFERVAANMRRVISSGIPLATNFTITKQNHTCLEAYIRLIETIGVSFANFTRLYNSGNARRNQSRLELSKDEMATFLKDLEAQQKKSRIPLILAGPTPLCFLAAHHVQLTNVNTCGAGKDEINILPNGDVTMCPSDATIAGNLLVQPLESIWHASLLANIGERKNAHPECKSCELFSVCGGCCLVSGVSGACKGCDVYMVQPPVKQQLKQQLPQTAALNP
ncbi:radical SAM protein [Candidatus Woesearchaeota archaeon]|nr:radical SAM protein [Candidatus Woesearchaeota archaeon]